MLWLYSVFWQHFGSGSLFSLLLLVVVVVSLSPPSLSPKHFYVCSALFWAFAGKKNSCVGWRGCWDGARIIISMRGHVLNFLATLAPCLFQVQRKWNVSGCSLRSSFLKGTCSRWRVEGGGHKNKNCCAEWKVRLAIWFELQSQSRYAAHTQTTAKFSRPVTTHKAIRCLGSRFELCLTFSARLVFI